MKALKLPKSRHRPLKVAAKIDKKLTSTGGRLAVDPFSSGASKVDPGTVGIARHSKRKSGLVDW